MRVSERLFLAVAPAIVGLFTVAALAYWGNYHRAAPEWVVVAATVGTVGSLVLAWQNTRYVARRIERLAGPGERRHRRISPVDAVRNAAIPRPGTSADELDSLEQVVDRLSGAVAAAEADSRRREAEAGERVQEYAALLAEASSAVSRQLDEVKLPLHILLQNHFGELNENQEEMLEAARLAADEAATELRRLKEIADLDRGALRFRREPVRIGELLKTLRPQLEADGRRIGVQVTLDVAPGLPRVAGDRVRLQQALELLLRFLVRHAAPESTVGVSALLEGRKVILTIVHGAIPIIGADIALARRVILAHGGAMEQSGKTTLVSLPVTGPSVPNLPDKSV